MKFWIALSFTEPTHLVPLAKRAEEVGFEGIFLADHLVYPETFESKYPYSEDGTALFDVATPFPEPWSAIAAMAAVTDRLRFSIAIYVLALHGVFEVAKAAATNAILSGGRVALGVGAGWMKEEFDLLGLDFRERGARMEEMIEVCRKLWTGKPVEHRGRHFDFPMLSQSPAPAESIPVWLGGAKGPALRRAARIGDGWVGHGHTPEEAEAVLDTLARLRAESGRSHHPFECIVPLTSEPEAATFERLASRGMTAGLSWPPSLAMGVVRPTLEQEFAFLEQYGENVIRPFGS